MDEFTAWVRIDWEERLGHPATRGDFGHLAWTMAEAECNQECWAAVAELQELHKISRSVGRFFTDFDVLLNPNSEWPSATKE